MAGETGSLGKKDLLDKFYTNPATVNICLALLELDSYDNIIEPSAGNGAFLYQLPKNAVGYDIEPANEGIIKADWFEVDKSAFSNNSLIVGNPPFGRQNSLAIRFFNESALFGRTIAFILPRSFRKPSIQNRLNLNFGLQKEILLPKESFSLNGELYDVPAVFQVWERLSIPRKPIKQKTTSKFFEFVTSDNADFRIQRVGGNAGRASLEFATASKSSNYFIKNKSVILTEDLVCLINRLVFFGLEDTVGPKSLAKGELVETLEQEIFDF